MTTCFICQKANFHDQKYVSTEKIYRTQIATNVHMYVYIQKYNINIEKKNAKDLLTTTNQARNWKTVNRIVDSQ